MTACACIAALTCAGFRAVRVTTQSRTVCGARRSFTTNVVHCAPFGGTHVDHFKWSTPLARTLASEITSHHAREETRHDTTYTHDIRT